MEKTPYRRDEQDLWNIIFIILFVAIFAWAFLLLKEVPKEISALDFFLIVFASIRATRLLTYDKITEFIRRYLITKETGPLRTMYELIICPWCTGIWNSLLLVFFYFLTPISWFFIFVLAVSGLATSVQVVINSITRK